MPSSTNLGSYFDSTNLRTFPLSSEEDISAVHKVLGTAELLESILKYLPFLGTPEIPLHDRRRSITVRPDVDKFLIGRSGLVNPQPQKLFAVQRVSRKFRDTIIGSTKLRRYMFLEPFGDVNDDPENVGDGPFGLRYLRPQYQQSPLRWFSRVCRGFKLQQEGTANIFSVRLHDWACMGNPSWTRQEASWRRIRITQYKNSDPVALLIDLKKRYPGRKGYFDMEVKYTEEKAFEADATMGDVYDAVLEVGSRCLEEHAEAMWDRAEEGY